jgi:hypothetical protein
LRHLAVRHLVSMGRAAGPSVPKLMELWPPADQALRSDLLKCFAAAGPTARSAAPMLLAEIAAGVPDTEAIPIADTLGHVGALKPVAMRKLLTDPRPLVRGHACLVLGHLGVASEVLLPELLRCAQHDAELRVRRDAVWALARMAPAKDEVLRVLLRALDSDDWLTTFNAKSGVDRLGLTKDAIVRRLEAR